MKTCVNCNSSEIVKNLNTGLIFCYDCKSKSVYRNCYECDNTIKEPPYDGEDNWHTDCWTSKLNNDIIDGGYT